MGSKRVIAAFDPSINNTGFAIKQDNNIIHSGVIYAKGKSDAEKLKSLFLTINELFKEYNFSFVILEITEFFSYKKHTNQYSGKSLNIRSLCKLNKAIAVIQLFCSLKNISIKEVTPAQWKGNLTKKTALSLTNKKNHNEAEAILMLL